MRFDAIQLVVNRIDRDGDRLALLLIGGMQRRPDAADDLGEQLDDGGKEEFAGTLALGVSGEDFVDQGVGQGKLHAGPHHDRERTVLGKPFVNPLAAHGDRLLECDG